MKALAALFPAALLLFSSVAASLAHDGLIAPEPSSLESAPPDVMPVDPASFPSVAPNPLPTGTPDVIAVDPGVPPSQTDQVDEGEGTDQADEPADEAEETKPADEHCVAPQVADETGSDVDSTADDSLDTSDAASETDTDQPVGEQAEPKHGALVCGAAQAETPDGYRNHGEFVSEIARGEHAPAAGADDETETTSTTDHGKSTDHRPDHAGQGNSEGAGHKKAH